MASSHSKQDPSAALVDTSETVRDIFTYPPAAPGAPSGDGAAVTTSLPGGTGRLAEETIRQALGWRYRPTDVRGFQAAIDRSFSLEEDDEGRVKAKWTPQTYAVQADMGEIIGAQASILEQTRVAVDYVLPLVEGLEPLRVDSDDEDTNAVITLVTSKLNAIKTELARVGGPRVQKLDLAYEELLGFPVVKYVDGAWKEHAIKDSDDWLHQVKTSKRNDNKTPYSLLHQLTEEFGLLPGLANTVEEERNLTNALIIVDSVIGLRTAWIGKRLYFDRSDTTKDRFLGTQLVWISRQLEVVAESVRDAYTAMDSVYFGPQEREATDIYYVKSNGANKAAGLAPITVADLLEWVYSFATIEGPQLLQDAGKDGVLALRSTVTRLEELVEAAHEYCHEGHGPAPCSFFNARVENALCGIEHQLEQVLKRAERISRAARPSAHQGRYIADLDVPESLRVEWIGAPFEVETHTTAAGAKAPAGPVAIGSLPRQSRVTVKTKLGGGKQPTVTTKIMTAQSTPQQHPPPPPPIQTSLPTGQQTQVKSDLPHDHPHKHKKS